MSLAEIMIDRQLKTILEMVNMILGGCKDLAEAKEKVQKLIDNQSSKKDDWRRVRRMALPAEKERYTLADYLTWEEDERVELIDGEAYMMSMPSSIHQEISVAITSQLYNFLEGKRCKVYAAPFSVRLFERDGDAPENINTVVEPDISVICDRGKIDKRGCKGAPDLVMEILSPSSLRHDRLVKLNLYQRAGVREYWIVDPENRFVEVFLLDAAGFFHPHEVYGQEDIAKVNVLDGCFIELSRVFAEISA